MGDYDDLASTKERKILNSTDLHESTRQSLDELLKNRTDKFIKEIDFMKGRIIGMIEGNHHGVFSDSNITSTQYMCQQLGCKYLGVSAFIRLVFHYGAKTACVDIWAHHGKGGARLVGSSLNTVQQMSDIARADIYLMGHDHKKSVAMKSTLELTNGGDKIDLTHSKILFARTGSFLKGYVPEKQSYIAGASLTPTDLGVVKIELTPKRSQKNDQDIFYIDLHASL